MNACELTTYITALANTLSCQLSTDELTLLGVIFAQLGDTLTTIVTQQDICSRKTAS